MKRNVIKQGGDYQYFEVTKEQPLLDFLLEHLQGQSRTKIKATRAMTFRLCPACAWL